MLIESHTIFCVKPEDHSSLLLGYFDPRFDPGTDGQNVLDSFKLPLLRIIFFHSLFFLKLRLKIYIS